MANRTLSDTESSLGSSTVDSVVLVSITTGPAVNVMSLSAFAKGNSEVASSNSVIGRRISATFSFDLVGDAMKTLSRLTFSTEPSSNTITIVYRSYLVHRGGGLRCQMTESRR